MSDVVRLSEWRPPVFYTVHYVHHWDGKLEFYVEDMGDDLRSKIALAAAMKAAAASLEQEGQTE